ncbi:MAG: ATPase [Candidatus Pacebacteria bacterium]|nr:ATPase [Candidatus Paceibacterota bacterium]
MIITKADGTQEPFRPEKLRASLRRAGATKHEVDAILRDIEQWLTEGVKTQAIYRKAFELLRQSDTPSAARYSLRRALFGLGPTGFPFEDFLAKLFETEGYTTKTRVTLKGKCTQHEIDVAGFTPAHSFVAEAKFHMRPGTKSDLQVVMYSYARFLDLQNAHICRQDTCGVNDFYVITNTKFTRTAMKYAECAGINLLSWNYPKHHSLHKRIEAAGLYPITALTTLSSRYKRALLETGVILCRDILRKPAVLQSAGVPFAKVDAVVAEAQLLYNSKNAP